MSRPTILHTLDADLDAIDAERDQVTRWPDGDKKFARLAELFGQEAELWKSLFSVTTSRTQSRSAIRAAQYAAGEAKRWAARVSRSGQTVPLEGPDFRARGNCARPGVDPDMFFDDRSRSATTARKVCTGCRVYTECLEYAIATGAQGVWAGTSKRERRAIRVKRQREAKARVA
jgi:WhiB family redox-sensing transcriptional regulator